MVLSFFFNGVNTLVVAGILKPPIVEGLVVVGIDTFGVAGDATLNLKPPIFGGVVVAGGDFPKVNVGVETTGEIADVALVEIGREVVTGEEMAVTVVVLLLLKVRSGGAAFS